MRPQDLMSILNTKNTKQMFYTPTRYFCALGYTVLTLCPFRTTKLFLVRVCVCVCVCVCGGGGGIFDVAE